MIVIFGIGTVAGILALIALGIRTALVIVDDDVPTWGPLRAYALARISRREALHIDEEHRALLGS